MPLARADGTDVLYWIRVRSESDLNPVGFDDYEDESQWQIAPGSAYRVEDYWGDNDTAYFCAVTGQDVAVFFHRLTDAPEVVYSRRGGTIPLPTGVSPLPRYDFVGWIDSEGNPVTEAIQLPIDCPTELHYYAAWEPNNNVQAEQISDIYVGTRDNGLSCTEITSDISYYRNNDGENCITISGYSGNEKDIYPDCQKTSMGGVGGPAGPLTVFVSRGFAARAGRFRHQPKPFLTFFAAVSFS